jgi:hypothetical protein
MDVLGAGEVLELDLAHVPEPDAGRQVVLDQLARGGRDEYLLAVGERRDPRRAMHPEADVVVRGDDGLARVQTHPDLDRGAIRPGFLRQRALACHHRGDRIARAREHHEERVAGGPDLAAVMPLEGLAQDAMVRLQDLRVRVAELVGQAGRAFDVREEEGERPARQGLLGGHGPVLPAGRAQE